MPPRTAVEFPGSRQQRSVTRALADFLEAYRSASYDWERLDRILLDACAATPHHTNVGDVFAKVALINRTYRANLQMGAKNAEWDVAERLVRVGFDGTIADVLPPLRLNRETAPLVVDVHRRLVEVCREITGRVQNSFASKYLAFHAPLAVPIFDGWAYKASWDLVGQHATGWLAAKAKPNADYGWHVEAVLLLAEHLRDAGVVDPDLKKIDIVLYGSRGGRG